MHEDDPMPLKTPLHRKKQTTSSKEKANFNDTLSKTQEILRIAKEKGQHTHRLMELEAEVAVIAKKGHESPSSYLEMIDQLIKIQKAIKSFQFKQPDQTKSPDYYAILGVSKNATADKIKTAYYQKMKEYHPDLHQNSQYSWIKEEAENKSKLVQQAYNILKDQKDFS